MTVFTIVICYSRKKGFRHLLTFTIKAFKNTDVSTRLAHFTHSASVLVIELKLAALEPQ